MGSLTPIPLPPLHSAEEAPSFTTCSPSPPSIIVLGQGDSDLPGAVPETTVHQSSLLGVCECTPGFAGD